ncbi:hypothetical protein DAPPUDRAFT_232048 [Daphnia pulex]|uniref:Uncharacterized protein n=1 Tax=Daphnia pulex TaxID=6669 RepID=E9FRT4_DAPPU|nr:hypothetical protein DAPPUDRAFT_232048 [Daphnia pulex]|eukprot:EFX90426.1 hypothetical protein DAPPUDRAFT_232048 [Daphnia pulex]
MWGYISYCVTCQIRGVFVRDVLTDLLLKSERYIDVSPRMAFLIVAGVASCLLASSVLATGNNSDTGAVTTTEATSTAAELYNLPCLPDSALNALLVQMLMALQPYFLSTQYQQQRMQFSNNNELFTATKETNQPIIRTTVVTSSVVSTLTQTLSKIISIWFRNERIPTTLYSQATTVMTDFITITSTLNVEPTEWNRERRELKDATFLESSLIDEDNLDAGYYGTQSLPEVDESFDVQALLPIHLSQPQVLEAWNNFLHL